MSDSKSIEELLQENQMLMQQIGEMSSSAHEMIKSQSHLESVLHNASEGVILFNPDRTIKSLNLAAQNIFGYQEVELMYQYGQQLFNVPDEYSDNVPAYLKSYLDQHPDTNLEPISGYNQKGEHIPLHMSVSEVAASDMVFFDDFSDGINSDSASENFELFACIFRDLSADIEAKFSLEDKNNQLEQAYISLSEHDRMRSEFLAKISHELLALLNGIIGMADILEQDVSEEQKEFVHVIKESGLKLENIISNILTFDSGNELVSEKTHFNLIELLHSYEQKFNKVLLTKKLAMTTDVDNVEEITTMYGYHEIIERVLDDLVDNALKFTESVGVHIHLNVTKQDNV